MHSVSYDCSNCQQYVKAEVFEGQEVHCPECAHVWGKFSDIANIFEQCPHCSCRQFYIQRDFNQALGCLILLVGIILVSMTKGISLPVFWLIDYFLYRRVEPMVICYQCGSEYRGFEIPETFKTFMHHIGIKYDNKRAKKKKSSSAK